MIGRGVEAIAGPVRSGALAGAVRGHAHVPDHVLVEGTARLLVDEGAVVADMLDTIARAERSVEVAQYILHPTGAGREILDALAARASGRDGRPPIDVAVLVDRQGSRQWPWSVYRRQFEQLEQDGVRVAVHRGPVNPFAGGVEHRKVMVADGQVAHVGGMGLGPSSAWHDVMVRLEGPVAAQAHADFVGRWVDAGGTVSAVQRALLHEADARGQHPAAIGARLVANDPAGARRATGATLGIIGAAREQLWVHTPYLGAREAAEGLAAAARAGVDARLSVNGSASAFPVAPLLSRAWYRALGAGRPGGVQVHEQGRMSHQKLVLGDEWVSAGSTNLTQRALRDDHELNVVSNDPALRAQVAAMMLRDEASSLRVQHDRHGGVADRIADSRLGAALLRGTVGRIA